MKRSKRFVEACKKIDPLKEYSLDEAIGAVKSAASTKFDESVDIAVRLGVDPRHAEQMVRGSVVLPNGLGREVKVLVFAKGDKLQEAKEAGADYIGGEELVAKVQGGWLEFDKAVATPDIMSSVGKLGRVLGPRGLMPNPKSGTVTFDVAKAVNEIKAGRVDFRVEKAGIIHAAIGRASFAKTGILENIVSFLEMIARLKPASSKGQYLKKIVLSSTMGPSVVLDIQAIRKMVNL